MQLVNFDKTLLQISSGNKAIYANTDYEAIVVWLKEFEQSGNTLIAYKQVAEKYYLWLQYHHLNLKDITREHIYNYQQFLSNPQPQEYWCGKALPRSHKDWKPFIRGLSDKSIKYHISTLRQMYNYLIQSGYLQLNPFALVKNITKYNKNTKPLERFFSITEFKLIIEYITQLPEENPTQIEDKIRIRWLIFLLFFTGCRRSEIANAKMSDFTVSNNQWKLEVTGKGDKFRSIPVTPELLQELVRYRLSYKLSPYPLKTERQIGLVLNKHDKLSGITHTLIYKLVKKLMRDLAEHYKYSNPLFTHKLQAASTHWLRHTSGSYQYECGVDDKVLQKNLGHASFQTTANYYIHKDQEAQYIETVNKFKLNE